MTNMEVKIAQLGRGETFASRDEKVIENRLLSHSDVGIYFRIKRALESGDGIEFYIDDRDPEIISALLRLSENGYIDIIPS